MNIMMTTNLISYYVIYSSQGSKDFHNVLNIPQTFNNEGVGKVGIFYVDREEIRI